MKFKVKQINPVSEDVIIASGDAASGKDPRKPWRFPVKLFTFTTVGMALLLGYTIWRENVLGNRLTQSQDAETGMKNQLLEYKELLQITQHQFDEYLVEIDEREMQNAEMSLAVNESLALNENKLRKTYVKLAQTEEDSDRLFDMMSRKLKLAEEKGKIWFKKYTDQSKLIDGVQANKEAAAEKITNHEVTIANLQAEKTQLVNLNTDLTGSNTQFQTDLETANGKLVAGQVRNQELADYISGLSDTSAKLTIEQAKLTDDLKNSKQTIAELQADNEQLQTTIIELTDNNTKLNDDKTSLNQIISKLTDYNTKLDEDYSRTVSDNKNLEDQLKARDEEIVILKQTGSSTAPSTPIDELVKPTSSFGDMFKSEKVDFKNEDNFKDINLNIS